MKLGETERRAAALIELGTESLGTHTGEARGDEGSNVLGFARFRLGDASPSDLVELVRQPRTSRTAIDAARTLFEQHGLKVAVCGDFAGRILDRLLRPYYNAALRRLDEGLATAADMDTTLKLGLGYPDLGNPQVVEPKVCRDVGLIVPREQGFRPGHVGPLSEPFAPPLVVLPDRVEALL